MNDNNGQSQFELFSSSSDDSTGKKKSPYLLANLVLSFENIIILAIVTFMGLVLSFSFGVERGKRVSKVNELDTNKAAVDSNINASFLSSAIESENVNIDLPEGSIDKNDVILKNDGKISENVYTVQVASFKKEKYAQLEAVKLQKKGFDIFVISKGDYSVVCVGKFLDKDNAKMLLQKLRKLYKDCLVRRL